MKHEHENKLARVLNVAPPEAYERGADGKRSWWRRALELFGTSSVSTAIASRAKMSPSIAR